MSFFCCCCCCSEDESELSDNETEQPGKGEGLLNGSSNGITINGSLSRDGRLSCFLSMFFSKPNTIF